MLVHHQKLNNELFYSNLIYFLKLLYKIIVFFYTRNADKPSIEELTENVQLLDISEKQKDKLEEFLKCREQIGEINNDDLKNSGELGSGNGGVVFKVVHKRIGTVMAKKVVVFFLP
jgi:hypothetical protein